ncbi:DegV family protein [Acidaminobacter sp. JC074]|uniref:DegV family protein n=1 Tax=Acidaminobacter sp. JC074 TaxID=2530199 RepID=UPI001F1080DA|nr:DegV family protein [Acidaminobacter sp. JC074]MCH4889472.1 DegV family protein [Acidaminobacter sp. JC074]
MYKIISDSSLDLNETLEQELDIEKVPFKLYIEEEEIIDNDELDVIDFIEKMKKSVKLPRTACPSPDDFKNLFEADGDVFAITISSKLSGTYNSAILAKNLVLEEVKKKIHVFDSKSASVGQTLIGMKIDELMKQDFSFDKIVEEVEKYITNMKTFFISENLNNLIKNGRIPSWKGKLAMALKIRPIMKAVDGDIVVHEQVRGSNKAFEKLAKLVCEMAHESGSKRLAISHVNNPERAKSLKARIQELCDFQEIVIVPTHGLTSLYCDDQGIILAF